MDLNCWDRLDIAPTDDAKQVKKAYAVLLKQHRPDKDPQGYQTLREAYDEAMALVAGGYVEAELQGESSDSLEIDLEIDSVDPEPSSAGQTEEEQAADAFFNSFLDKMELLLTQPKPFSDLDKWQALLTESELDSIDIRRWLSLPVFSLLSYYLLEKKQEAWDQNVSTTLASLDETFGWQDSELELERHFTVEQVDAVMILVGGDSQRLPPSASDEEAGSSSENFWRAVFFWPILLLIVFVLTKDLPSSRQAKLNNISVAEERSLKQEQNRISDDRDGQAEPDLTPALMDLQRSQAWQRRGQDAQAASALIDAVGRTGDSSRILNEATWFFATHWNSKIRDAKRALEYAQVLEGMDINEWGPGLDTIATAYAANGNFTRALELQHDAIAAYVEGDAPDEVIDRVDLYKASRAYIAPKP